MFEVSIFTFFVGVVAVLIVVAIGLFIRDLAARRKERQAQRLGSLVKPRTLRRMVIPHEQPPADTVLGQWVQWSNVLIAESGSTINPAAGRVLVLLFGTAVGGPLLLGMESIPWGVGGFAFGCALPLLIWGFRGSRRRRNMETQLPSALYLLARAVRAGESPDQAIRLAADETPKPLGGEFSMAAKQMEMGLALPMAMRGMARRTRLSDLRLFATTLMLHRQTGGNLAMTLERLADVMRDRLEYRRTLRSSTAGGRLSMLVIVGAGVLALFYFMFFKPEYIDRMTENKIGLWMLFVAGMLFFTGVIWLVKLLKSEY